jgi:hypothetical protein
MPRINYHRKIAELEHELQTSLPLLKKLIRELNIVLSKYNLKYSPNFCYTIITPNNKNYYLYRTWHDKRAYTSKTEYVGRAYPEDKEELERLHREINKVKSRIKKAKGLIEHYKKKI